MAAPPGDRIVNRRYLHIAAAAVTLLGLSAWFAPAPRLLWNASQSAPIGLYRIDAGDAPVVGDLVAISPPADLAAYMARRNYLPRGVPLLKRVAALPGARVCRSGVFVTVDGRAVARALARDRAAAAGLARLPHRADPRNLPDQRGAGQSRRAVLRTASDHRSARNGAPDPDPRRPGRTAALAPFGPRSCLSP
jgi:type IV secretory pathway protease TraF